MSDETLIPMDKCVPAELQQERPRRFRLAAKGVYYLLGSLVVSTAALAVVIALSIHDAKMIKKGNELAHEGQLVYTDDVRAGGGRNATVYYSFNYNGERYRGSAFLPKEHLSQVEQYSKSGSFPVLFLPSNPSVNHPSDWHDTETLPWMKYLFVLIVIFQWSYLVRFILRDLRLVRCGVAAVGRVIGRRYGRSGGIWLKYEFRDIDGMLTEGKGEYPEPKKKDEQICVLYFPDETSKSRPYPLVFFRAVK